MVTQIIDVSASQEHFFPQKTAPAWGLGPQERKTLSLQVLSQTEPVSRLAQKNGVSRKFLYQQAAKASDAIDEAFSPSTGDEEKVLFYGSLKEFVGHWPSKPHVTYCYEIGCASYKALSF